MKKDPKTGWWYEIGDDKARAKVGHAICGCLEPKSKFKEAPGARSDKHDAVNSNVSRQPQHPHQKLPSLDDFVLEEGEDEGKGKTSPAGAKQTTEQRSGVLQKSSFALPTSTAFSSTCQHIDERLDSLVVPSFVTQQASAALNPFASRVGPQRQPLTEDDDKTGTRKTGAASIGRQMTGRTEGQYFGRPTWLRGGHTTSSEPSLPGCTTAGSRMAGLLERSQAEQDSEHASNAHVALGYSFESPCLPQPSVVNSHPHISHPFYPSLPGSHQDLNVQTQQQQLVYPSGTLSHFNQSVGGGDLFNILDESRFRLQRQQLQQFRAMEGEGLGSEIYSHAFGPSSPLAAFQGPMMMGASGIFPGMAVYNDTLFGNNPALRTSVELSNTPPGSAAASSILGGNIMSQSFPMNAPSSQVPSFSQFYRETSLDSIFGNAFDQVTGRSFDGTSGRTEDDDFVEDFVLSGGRGGECGAGPSQLTKGLSAG